MTKRDIQKLIDGIVAKAIAAKLGPAMVTMQGIDVVGRAAVGVALSDPTVIEAILRVGCEPNSDEERRVTAIVAGELEVPDLPETVQPESLKKANANRAVERELAKKALEAGLDAEPKKTRKKAA